MEWSKGMTAFFRKALLKWHMEDNNRILPWKQERDPYKIWLSEIILQQTRAAQGLPYYLRFAAEYPTIHDLAAAEDEAVFRLWQGLGYYNRCRNLLHTARYIAGKRNGHFPDDYHEIRQLKGIGSYTAAAIASFAFHQPYAVVDGNVLRVLSRFGGIDTPVDTPEGKKVFQVLAQELLDKEHNAAYNQAIMDFGASVCTPAIPKCVICPLTQHCKARQQGIVSELPLKSKKLVVKSRFFHYLWMVSETESVWIRKRDRKDIWQNLFEPFLIEHAHQLGSRDFLQHPSFPLPELHSGRLIREDTKVQRLTHQLITMDLYTVRLTNAESRCMKEGIWVAPDALKNYAFPKSLVSFLEKKLYF